MINLDILKLNIVFDYLYQIFDIFGELANLPWRDIYDFIGGRLDSITLSSTSLYGYTDIVVSLDSWVYRIIGVLVYGPVYMVQDICLNMFNIPVAELTLWQASLLSLIPLSFCFFFISIIKKAIGLIP